MKRSLLNHIVPVALCLCHTLFSRQVPAQTLLVNGTVSTSTTAVRYASVSFEQKANPTATFSALTDSAGRYQLAINLTSVEPIPAVPTKFELGQNYPNPFSSSTVISYELKTQAVISVTIFDVLGRVLREPVAAAQGVGTHSVLWDGRNMSGHKAAPGVYFYSLRAGGESQVKKMLLRGGSDGVGSLLQNPLAPTAQENQVLPRHSLGGTFTVRIENTSSTFPLITSKTIDNVAIQSDTTCDFLVENQMPVPVSTVYIDSVQQHIRGFGGANIINWRPAMTVDQIQKAFGASEGELGFSILRLRIPYNASASEFGANVPVAQMAQSLGAIVFASPWTPPPALKSNDSIVGGTLNDSSYAAFAAHLKAFADYMASNGAPLYAVSLQNEPDANVTYESCSWNASQFLKFMKNNAGAIGARIMMPESQNFVHALSDSTLNDSAAAAHVAIVAGHIYGGGLGPYPLAVSKGKEVWMTEHLELDTSWTAVLATGREIHDCMEAGMNAYVWWYIVRFYGPIGEDGNATKRGYVMSQYARFVRPGYHKIKCNAFPQRYVWISSYKDSSPSKVVVVALNTSTSSVQQAFTMTSGSMTSVSPFTTSKSKNCEKGANISVVNGSFTAVLEPSSITTFVSN
jgi:glucuronoarabinoxylan endo-1,4-beta-xylanase